MGNSVDKYYKKNDILENSTISNCFKSLRNMIIQNPNLCHFCYGNLENEYSIIDIETGPNIINHIQSINTMEDYDIPNKDEFL